MSYKRLVRRKGVVSSANVYTRTNSLDWDSPSTKTGTVKRRPVSTDCSDNSKIGKTSQETCISNGNTQDSSSSHIHRQLKIFLRDKSYCIQNPSDLKAFSYDNPKCLSLTEFNAYLIERKASGLNFAKAGVVSDSDSGIASPLSPSSLHGFLLYGETRKLDYEICSELERLRKCSCISRQLQIYTDWANHYLEKARSKKRVNSLATDCSDGVLLAEVIESVTCQKIPDINRKPKTPSQMLDNINICLSVLRTQHVSGVESVSGQDLRDGRLKAVLALFFALSRHKQATKQKAHHIQQQQQQFQQIDMTPNRSLVGAHKGGSSIPLPGSALPSRKCPPDKIRPVAGSSRATSPAMSMIPRVPPPPAVNSPYQSPPQQKNSMLDKLKLFKSGDRPTPTPTGKRTSSSSGVSSARSERSDSSVSLDPNSDIKPVRNNSRIKQRPQKNVTSKSSPVSNKKELKVTKTAVEVEKHAQKVAGLSVTKLTESKMKAPVCKSDVGLNKNLPQGPPTLAPGTGIPKPTAAIKGTSKVPREDKNTSAIKSPTTISRESSQASIAIPKATVALVSPMKNNIDHQLSESSHSASTGHHSNSSDSSVIYKPSSESGSEHTNIIPNRKEPLEYLSDVTEQNRHLDQIPEKPLSHINIVVNHVREGSQGDDDLVSMNVEPMRPLFRGYCSTLTLPGRSRNYATVPDTSDYCEISLANGYLSDGEVLRNPSSRDLCDGYMSEGGTALYSRRLQAMPAHITNGNPRVPGSLTVLTEQSSRRGRVEEPPPPPAPRVSSRSSRNAAQIQDGKHGQWKRYTDSPGVGSPPPPPAPAPSSPTGSRRERRSSPHGSKEKSSKVRGVPQSFGYIKRNSNSNGTNGTCSVNGTSPPATGIWNCSDASNTYLTIIPAAATQNSSGKTAQVSAVPRTKVKVSGGTQTCSSDLQQPQKTQYKSYSLTGNTANQLSQSVRERLLMGSQSLPKGAGSGQEYGLVLRQARVKASDGSLSDTQVVDVSSPYAPWLRHSNTYSVAPRLSETDSLESLSSIPGHRGSLTHTRLLRDSPSRLSRSNSISYLRDRTFPRSTKSEKLYPSMLHRNTEPDTEPYYCLPVGAVLSHWSQPTSPAPGSTRTFPLSPTHSTPRHSIPKNDDVHGSSISLVSTASSLYSSAEEKQAHEIRKLRRELTEAQEKVQTLTSQLSTNFLIKKRIVTYLEHIYTSPSSGFASELFLG
ncbi:hypothetical protein PPYR_04894 [Photinus pyralis]|uniref:Calponin-homology (CH) domain-containing protein n=1 Tax=Photinus pyralis TaxID=7054 RepID=A0A5N4AZL5_PHOPY|nr:hypothetical protein PPYR_04894 [Photinus pyralis]